MRRVFLSFQAEDIRFANLLRATAANDRFDLEFYDESVKEAYNSNSAEYIKTKIRAKIDRATYTICLIGDSTHKSDWVCWELSESIKKDKGIICMALPEILRATLPSPVNAAGYPFIVWDVARLSRMIPS